MTSTPAKRASWRAPAALALLFVAAAAFYWSGLGPGDAERYFRAALRWQDGPWLGDTHWALRHLYVLPMAASFAAFGASEAAAILPNLAYAALMIVITWIFGRRVLGARDAFLFSALIATSAFFVARPLEVDVAGVEAFFCALAVWLFIAANDAAARGRTLFFAGLAAGLAWSVREQSVYLLAVFGALTVAERRDILRSLALVGAGFGAVIAAELVVYAVAADDPFYRYKIDLGHRTLDANNTMTPERAAFAGRVMRAFLSLTTTPSTTPVLLFAAIAAVYLRGVKAGIPASVKRTLWVFGVAAAASSVSAPLAFNIDATRYYPLLTYMAFLIVAVALGALSAQGRPRLALAGVAAVVAVNAAAADFVRADHYAEARYLASRMESIGEPVYADALTVNRTRYLLMLDGWSSGEAAAAVRNARDIVDGALFFRSSLADGAGRAACVLETLRLRRSGWTHILLRESGIAHLLGRSVKARVATPQPAMLLRVKGEPSANSPASSQACPPTEN